MNRPHDKPSPGQGDGSRGWATTRRQFLRGLGLAGAVSVLPRSSTIMSVSADTVQRTDGLEEWGRDAQSLTLNVNGRAHTVKVQPRATLLEVLRYDLGLTGTKSICEHGACGGCSVLWDGRAVQACLCLAIEAHDHEIITVEGIADDPRFVPLIESFCAHDAAQCGFCSAGFVVRAAELFLRGQPLTRDEVRRELSGNLCRCGAYTKIAAAVTAALARGGAA